MRRCMYSEDDWEVNFARRRCLLDALYRACFVCLGSGLGLDFCLTDNAGREVYCPVFLFCDKGCRDIFCKWWS